MTSSVKHMSLLFVGAALKDAVNLTLYGEMQVLDRILRVDYKIPRAPRVSDECKDLLQRVLVADPFKRLTIPQIQVRICFHHRPTCLDFEI